MEDTWTVSLVTTPTLLLMSFHKVVSLSTRSVMSCPSVHNLCLSHDPSESPPMGPEGSPDSSVVGLHSKLSLRPFVPSNDTVRSWEGSSLIVARLTVPLKLPTSPAVNLNTPMELLFVLLFPVEVKSTVYNKEISTLRMISHSGVINPPVLTSGNS